MVYTPYQHQREGLEIAKQYPRYLYGWTMGSGKCSTALSIIKHLGRRSLYITKKNLVENAVLRDQERFFPGMPFHNLCGMKPKDRHKAITDPKNIHLVHSFEGFRQDIEHFMKAVRPVLVVDESSVMRDHGSKLTKAIMRYAEKCEHVYLMSGLPFPNGYHQAWPQLRTVDPDTWERNFFAWRAKWMIPAKKIWNAGREIVTEWKINPRKKDEFHEKLGRRAWFLKKEDIKDVTFPEKVFEERRLEMPPELRKVYDQILNEWVTMVNGDEIIAKTKLTELMKLRQITAGFILNANGEAHQLEEPSYKTKELLEIMEETDEPIIVSAQFRAEIASLVKILKEKGFVCESFYGDTPANERERIVSEFQDGKIRVLVGHPRSFGHGLSLTRSSVIVFHSLSYSWDEHAQTIDRVHRIGQRKLCTYTALISKNTIDELIWQVLQRKEHESDLAAEIVRGILSSRKREEVGV